MRFDGSASTAGLGATIVSYVWDFGDNTSSSGTTPTTTHQYNASGTYNATLTVTDSNGLSHKSPAQAVLVGAGIGPTASFVFSPTAPQINQTVFFNGTGSTAGPGHQIVRYDWDFGAGSRRSGTDATVSKAYDDPGAYTVVLTVTDEVGQTAQATRIVSVGGGQPAAHSRSHPLSRWSISRCRSMRQRPHRVLPVASPPTPGTLAMARRRCRALRPHVVIRTPLQALTSSHLRSPIVTVRGRQRPERSCGRSSADSELYSVADRSVRGAVGSVQRLEFFSPARFDDYVICLGFRRWFAGRKRYQHHRTRTRWPLLIRYDSR